MWYQLRAYIKFLKASTNQHGVHSPFVYHLITKCFYDKKTYPEYKILNQYRSALLNNHDTICVKDFGAGSRVFKNNQRKIADIAKHAGISKKRAQLLYRIVKYFSPDHILELGTSLGISTAALQLGHPNAIIKTVEGCRETANIAKKQLGLFNFKHIDLRVSDFKDELALMNDQQLDMVYIDGNHQKDATINYFECLLAQVHNDSVLIFDDIHWSKGMTEAWNYIKQHKKVRVTIDTYFWGLVFFRTEQQKQDFVIRC